MMSQECTAFITRLITLVALLVEPLETNFPFSRIISSAKVVGLTTTFIHHSLTHSIMSNPYLNGFRYLLNLDKEVPVHSYRELQMIARSLRKAGITVSDISCSKERLIDKVRVGLDELKALLDGTVNPKNSTFVQSETVSGLSIELAEDGYPVDVQKIWQASKQTLIAWGKMLSSDGYQVARFSQPAGIISQTIYDAVNLKRKLKQEHDEARKRMIADIYS